MYYYNSGEIIAGLIVGALLALIPAKIASDKGRSFGLWWVYGFFLWLIALIHAAVIQKEADTYDSYRTDSFMNPPEPPEQAPPAPLEPVLLSDQGPVDVVHFPTRSVDSITCPVCRKTQMPNRRSCFSCGARFVYDDELSESGEVSKTGVNAANTSRVSAVSPVTEASPIVEVLQTAQESPAMEASSGSQAYPSVEAYPAVEAYSPETVNPSRAAVPAAEERRPRFCRQCGQPLLSPDSRFCHLCGTAVLTEPNR